MTTILSQRHHGDIFEAILYWYYCRRIFPNGQKGIFQCIIANQESQLEEDKHQLHEAYFEFDKNEELIERTELKIVPNWEILSKKEFKVYYLYNGQADFLNQQVARFIKLHVNERSAFTILSEIEEIDFPYDPFDSTTVLSCVNKDTKVKYIGNIFKIFDIDATNNIKDFFRRAS